MKKMKYVLIGFGMALFLSNFQTAIKVRAASNNYVTIKVDAVDDSDSLQYAIDSDAPEAFSDNSSFQVVPGSTHTIYVRDSAGNVSSQVYSIPEQENKTEQSAQSGQDSTVQASTNVSESYDADTDERKVNIDVNLSNGTYSVSGSAAEDGGGTLYDKEKTNGTDEAGKIFYTVTTKEGEVFYLVVDQNRSDNNVYLLTQATVNDLQYLADQNDYNFTVSATGQNSQSLLQMLSGPNGVQGTEVIQQPGSAAASTKSETNSTLLMVVVVVIGGGGYYVFKTKKNRRERQMDEIDAANDLQDYEIEGGGIEDEEDELTFEEAPDGEDTFSDDEELEKLMGLDTEMVFGEDGEEENVMEAVSGPEQADEFVGEDEFGEEEF